MSVDTSYAQYCFDVLTGATVAGRYTRQACQRHADDIEHGAERGLYFDDYSASRAIAYFERTLKHSKGRWARKPLLLEPWQQFCLAMIFGWKRADGTRRFRTAYIEVGRKNGKSVFASGIGLYLVHADGEPGAEVYTAATKIEQARIIHQESIRMVKQSPRLSADLRVLKNNINRERTFSKYEPLGSNSETLDGLNVHGALVDEIHAHPNRDLWDVLETGTGARMQPLMLGITTAGYSRQSFGYELHAYCESILDGVYDNDAWFGIIYSLDVDPDSGDVEDWENEEAWVKANPNLGVSKFIDGLRDKAYKAKQQPSALNGFLTKELNIWTSSRTRAINPVHWAACDFGPVDETHLIGRRCWIGVDLSSTTDITAEIIVFEPIDDEPAPVVCRFWIPEENILDRVKRDRVPFDVWARQGLVALTPGNVIDDAYIFSQIKNDFDLFDVQELAFDPWNATWLSNQLQAAGVEVDRLVEYRQGYVTMNGAIDQLTKTIYRHQINHGGNAPLGWMSANLVLEIDPADNKKPSKARSRERIDGMVALAMANDRRALQVDDGVHAYDDGGIFIL